MNSSNVFIFKEKYDKYLNCRYDINKACYVL